jgi:hypothetical protein
VSEQQELVPFSPETGIEGFDESDLVIPRMRIAQPTNTQGWEPGKFVESLSEEAFPELTGVVALKIQKTRVFFESPGDERPRCASDDNVRPSPPPRVEDPISEACADCPKSKWTEDEFHARQKPDCSEQYAFLIAHEGMPYFVTFHGAALTATKKLITALVLRGKQKKLPIWGFSFDIGLKDVKFAQGHAYMPVFRNIQPVKKDEVEGYGEMHTSYTATDVKVAEGNGDVTSPFGSDDTTDDDATE